jgi:hypothetical protein
MHLRLCFILSSVMLALPGAAGTKVTLDQNGLLQLDGIKTFVISFALPPPPGGKTPEGTDAFAELKSAGANFMRIRPHRTLGRPLRDEDYDEEGLHEIQAWLDSAASQGMHCWVTLAELPVLKPGQARREALLRKVILRFKDHPGLGAWKGADEPAWGKIPAEACLRAYKVFKELDPNHPVILIQAPEPDDSLPLQPYARACDITGMDIYPIAYPPGKHGHFPNKEISVVADATKWIVSHAEGKPVWMTLQIAFGGTATAKKTLRFPTFPQERYMAYAALINGARGINYQGGALPLTLNAEDSRLEWNWTFWRQVMRRLVVEIGQNSPLYPALLAADSKLPIKISGGDNVEFCAREADNHLFIIAARRESGTSQVTFSGLPAQFTDADVLFEAPRKVKASQRAFEDWFGPNEVHVYRFTQSAASNP